MHSSQLRRERSSVAKKSLIKRCEVDAARKAHNCQANNRHRLERGHLRLKIWKERSPDHYCMVCAVQIIERDFELLRTLTRQLKGELPLEKNEDEAD